MRNHKTIGSWIVILWMFGVVYYAADKVLANVEHTINQTVITNVLATQQQVDAMQITWSIVDTWVITLWQVVNSGNILTNTLSWVDNWNLDLY